MFMRISWGRIREGGWMEYEERFKKLALDNIKQGGPKRRWLVRDLDKPDARDRVKTEMADLYVGDYCVRNCEVRYQTD